MLTNVEHERLISEIHEVHQKHQELMDRYKAHQRNTKREKIREKIQREKEEAKTKAAIFRNRIDAHRSRIYAAEQELTDILQRANDLKQLYSEGDMTPNQYYSRTMAMYNEWSDSEKAYYQLKKEFEGHCMHDEIGTPMYPNAIYTFRDLFKTKCTCKKYCRWCTNVNTVQMMCGICDERDCW